MTDSDSTPERGAYDDWVPADYLNEYYAAGVQADEREVIRFFVSQMHGAPAGPALCFGCGPTLHHVFLLAPVASQVSLADYVPANLEEIDRWRAQAPGAHDWEPFVRYTLECESGTDASSHDVSRRMTLLRQRLAALLRGDATLDDPLGADLRAKFAIVLSPYCCEVVTTDKAKWARYMRNIASLVRPGGLFLTAAVRHCHQYKSGPRFFPTAHLDEDDLRAALLQDFRADSIDVSTRAVPEHDDRGFSGILLGRGVRDGLGPAS
jgi:SAM-dependent methyltransferase